MQNPDDKPVALTLEQARALAWQMLREQTKRLSNRVTTRPEIQEQIKRYAEAKRARKAAKLKGLPSC